MIRFLLKERIAEKEFNEKQRIKLDDLSRDTGISRATLSRITNTYDYNTTTDVLNRLCNYFQCDLAGIVEYIMDEEQDNSK